MLARHTLTALTALLAAVVAVVALPALAQDTKPKPRPATPAVAAKPAPRLAAPPRRAPAPPPAAALPAASDEQLGAAAIAHIGPYACEFAQTVNVSKNIRNNGYVDVRWANTTWVTRPVLSSTGALRLEDVGGRVLMLQIANKSMLMDVQLGRRLVDECVHETQRAATLAAAAAFAAGANPAQRLLLSPAELARTADLKLRLLQTTDLHMALLDYDYYQDKPTVEYGLARTATLMKAARAQVSNTLLFDNGDLLQGGPLGDTAARSPLKPGQVHPAYKVMNALRYDAANIGNHDFNFGLDFLRQAIATAAFPYVNANILFDDGSGKGSKNAFTPYVLLERRFKDEAGAEQVLKVGVIGFVPPQVMTWDRVNLTGRVVARDIPETAREWVPRMRAAGADVVVVIAHSGFERGETVFFAENTVARLAEVPGVNAILFGHSHGEFPGRFFSSHPLVNLERGTINGVPAVMPGFWGSHLGVVDLTLTRQEGRWTVADGRAELRPIFDRATRQALVEADASIAPLIAEEHQATLAYMRAPVAQSTLPLQSYFSLVADDASLQLINAAQAAYAKRALATTEFARLPLLSAASPFKSGGRMGSGFFVDVPAGAVAYRNVADLYVFPNLLNVVKLSGAQVREWLEASARVFNRIDPAGPAQQMLVDTTVPGFSFDVIDGVSYRIDVTQPNRYDRSGKLVAPGARRIVDLRYQGQPIDDKAEFLVATNSYRASGGDRFPGLDGASVVYQAPDENRQALLQYLSEQKTVTPQADDNWGFVPVPGVSLRYLSSSRGIGHLARYPQLRLVQDNGDGWAQYEVRP